MTEVHVRSAAFETNIHRSSNLFNNNNNNNKEQQQKRIRHGSISARAALLVTTDYTGIGPQRGMIGQRGLPSPPPELAEEQESLAGLPPLYEGHPTIHIKAGIVNAARASAQHRADAEAAFFVADLGQVYRQHLKWQKYLPDIEPFYAVKANPDLYVLRLLAALGTGFDCASQNEINMVCDIGVNGDRIIFANPCKAASFVRHAARRGVDMMTFDNTDELYKIARAHPTAKLVVRILTDDSRSVCRLGLKFGAPIETVPTLLAKARELELDVVGVSFHVGSGCYDSTAYAEAISLAKMAFEYGKNAGYEFDLLDVGGGFEDGRFEETARVLREALDVHFPERATKEGRRVRVIAEPGRFYVSSAFELVVNIIARRGGDGGCRGGETVEEGDPRVMYYINDGVYGSFNCILFDHQVVTPYCLTIGKVLVEALGNESAVVGGTKVMSSVWGPTCDSIDRVCERVELPSGLEVGDWLGFRKMGAYTVCAASRFNGFDTTPVIYTIGEEKMVRSVLEG